MGDLKDRIKLARERAGLTQEELGAACGVSRAAVSLWETDKGGKGTTPRYEKLKTIARATGQPVEWFLESGEIASIDEEILTIASDMPADQVMTAIRPLLEKMTIDERVALARMVLGAGSSGD